MFQCIYTYNSLELKFSLLIFVMEFQYSKSYPIQDKFLFNFNQFEVIIRHNTGLTTVIPTFELLTTEILTRANKCPNYSRDTPLVRAYHAISHGKTWNNLVLIHM